LKLLTIVVCTHNGAAFLGECVDSIVAQQAYDAIVEEVYIVDNASSDATKEIALKFAGQFPSIRYIYEPQLGVSYARRHAAFATTEWIAYIDDDNIIMPNWLSSLERFIQNYSGVGVINGANIPELRFRASENELVTLRSMLGALACTHLDMDEIKNGYPSRLAAPFGAGLVLRRKPLAEFLEAGWTKNVGRSGANLSSGEDGEIARAVLRAGYEYRQNLSMVLRHVIPRSRLQNEYVNKLFRGLDLGYYNYVSHGHDYISRRLEIFVRSAAAVIAYPVRIHMAQDEVRRIMLRRGLVSKLRFIRLVLSDLLLLRRHHG